MRFFRRINSSLLTSDGIFSLIHPGNLTIAFASTELINQYVNEPENIFPGTARMCPHHQNENDALQIFLSNDCRNPAYEI